MTSEIATFKKLDKSYNSRVKIGSGEFLEVKGKGEISVETPAGTKLISEVLYVPDIDQNLLSVGQMLEKQYSLLFKNKTCTIMDPAGNELMQVKMKDRSFSLRWNKLNAHAFSSSVDESTLWHRRFGHFNFDALKHMYDKCLVQNMPVVLSPIEVCDVCQFGKQTRIPFPINQSWRAVEKLQLVHSDVCGPMSSPSLNGSKYFVLFIDDFSRFCWVYFLQQKSEVLRMFQKFKAAAENQCNSKIKILRTDNGTEYALSLIHI